ncbi:MAG: ribose-phosphate pyrophosphokinase [Neomegalonema sp.]|nr:ribose-phosphate pyrophosphokinase [Neomegalonema sp.]
MQRVEGAPRLIAGGANRPLAQDIATALSQAHGDAVDLAQARIERFADSEIFVEIMDNVRGEDVFVLQPTSNPANDNFMELLIMIDAARRSSAHRITAVMPYFGYARQDRRTAPRTPITAKLVANLITQAGANRVLTLDLHAGQIQGFFDIPTDNLSAAPVFAIDIRRKFADLNNVVVVSPDVGGVVRARNLAGRIGADLAIVDKRREKANEVEAMMLIGSVKGRDCVIVDDICDTAGTLCKAAALLREHGAASVHAYIAHGVLSEKGGVTAASKIDASELDRLVVTDSIAFDPRTMSSDKIERLSIAPLMAQAILNVGNDTSVSSLFDEASVEPIYAQYYASIAG